MKDSSACKDCLDVEKCSEMSRDISEERNDKSPPLNPQCSAIK